MTSVKLKKSWLKTPATLLHALGAVTHKIGLPQHVYVSKQDYALLKKNLRTFLRKECRGYSSGSINIAVEFELLNLGPNEGLAEGIRPGYAVVDYAAIRIAKIKGVTNGKT